MARPKVILQLYPIFPAEDEEDRKAAARWVATATLYHRVCTNGSTWSWRPKMGVWGASRSSITCIPKATRSVRIPAS